MGSPGSSERKRGRQSAPSAPAAPAAAAAASRSTQQHAAPRCFPILDAQRAAGVPSCLITKPTFSRSRRMGVWARRKAWEGRQREAEGVAERQRAEGRGQRAEREGISPARARPCRRATWFVRRRTGPLKSRGASFFLAAGSTTTATTATTTTTTTTSGSQRLFRQAAQRERWFVEAGMAGARRRTGHGDGLRTGAGGRRCRAVGFSVILHRSLKQLEVGLWP
ncbi:hypothetical protein AOQ84DRAFT_193001 [Glonium stellatum]|uniref:Uncharacterized protein n=1 Tax=Glonium stellatum TaxID=574774 RepID=A0A8E2JMH2_9PEZI|nr:hypothetical protein AOQ84DRAFT_193001 [Glonium stellatum]